MPRLKHRFPEFLLFCCGVLDFFFFLRTFKYWNDLCSVVPFLPVISIVLLIISLNFSEEDFFLFHTVNY